jgi:hypothetical protein
MQDLNTTNCQCTTCVGDTCTCGCQSNSGALDLGAACPCGPDCQCGPACDCEPVSAG